jgi:hypothetical protein
LHGAANPRMYGVLTANTPGCVAFSLPCSAGNFKFEDSSVFRLHRKASAPRGPQGGAVLSPSGAGPRPLQSQGRFRAAAWPRISGPLAGPNVNLGERFGAQPLPSATNIGGTFCRQRVPDGPTLDAPDCIADQNPQKIRILAERQLRLPFYLPDAGFGSAPRVAFRSSPHPRIRWTVASPDSAPCALGSTRPPPPRVPKCPTKC